jgi:hypothetical protein
VPRQGGSGNSEGCLQVQPKQTEHIKVSPVLGCQKSQKKKKMPVKEKDSRRGD